MHLQGKQLALEQKDKVQVLHFEIVHVDNESEVHVRGNGRVRGLPGPSASVTTTFSVEPSGLVPSLRGAEWASSFALRIRRVEWPSSFYEWARSIAQR